MIGKGKKEGFDHKGTDNPLVLSKNYVCRIQKKKKKDFFFK